MILIGLFIVGIAAAIFALQLTVVIAVVVCRSVAAIWRACNW